jgi:LmbE family N-acetylglucosaminyl deacetylase
VAEAVVFFHAHPDDEAIFTGGTMAKLATSGVRVVLLVATCGELGMAVHSSLADDELASHRAAETCRAAEMLGVGRVEFLGYRDSGMLGDPANHAAGAFWSSDSREAVTRVANLLAEEQATALVVYDERGIYGHPDHVKVHSVGVEAAARAEVPTVYEATVDREYLHFVETHLVAETHDADLGLAASAIGAPTVMITNTVDVRDVLDVKRAAMAAHASQIPETASAMRLPTEAFTAVYGYEWYVRRGPVAALDRLATA